MILPKLRKRQSISLLCRPTKPEQCHLGALRSPLSPEIQRSEVDLGFRVPLLRGFAVPTNRLSIVLLHSLALLVRDAEIPLGASVPLLGSPAVPARGFSVILRHPAALVVHEGEEELGVSVPLLGSFSVPLGQLRNSLG